MVLIPFIHFNKEIIQNKPPKQTIGNIKLIPESEDNSISTNDGEGKNLNSGLHKECQYSYEGVGILYGSMVDEIYHILPSYPADLAGLQIGDILINAGAIPKDGYLDLVINRKGNILKFHIKTRKICFEDMYEKH